MSRPFTCREAASLLTEYRERTIPWPVRVRTGLHLRFCAGCRALFADLGLLSSLLQTLEPLPPADDLAIGQAALRNAMARLHETRKARRLPETPIPPAIQPLLRAGADLPLRLMAQAHAALMNGTASPGEPFLPEEVLTQLPAVKDWPWRHYPGGDQRALLWAEGNGPCLSILRMPPKFSSPPHRHRGTESLLVLDGELEHADRCLTNGDWVHLEQGSAHAPYAFDRGCWCLVRDEGTIQYAGPLGWLRKLRASA